MGRFLGLQLRSGGRHAEMRFWRQPSWTIAHPTDRKGLRGDGLRPGEDGSRYLPTAKKIFGDKFDAFKTINSDEKNRERLRAEGLATYAKKNGLAVTLYQDYGWPAKKLKE